MRVWPGWPGDQPAAHAILQAVRGDASFRLGYADGEWRLAIAGEGVTSEVTVPASHQRDDEIFLVARWDMRRLHLEVGDVAASALAVQ